MRSDAVTKWLEEGGIATITYDIGVDCWIGVFKGKKYKIKSISMAEIAPYILSVVQHDCWLMRADFLEKLATQPLIERIMDK